MLCGFAGNRVRLNRRHGRAWFAVSLGITYCLFGHSDPDHVAGTQSSQLA